MANKIFQVDAFTDRPFSGNPAGVCILQEPAREDWMQNVAREMNLSETAFLVRQGPDFNLRWFTPATEVALCGHATLASAHILWETGALKPGEQARFHTLSGLLSVGKKDNWIEMNFPATPAITADEPPGLAQALGARMVYIGKNRFDYLIEIESEDQLRSLQPDYGALNRQPVRGVIVTSRPGADSARLGYDFISRFFAPAVGVNEDPVTGSAHCCLTPYWSQKLGKDEMKAFQASARGGILHVHAAGDRVIIAGQAVTVMIADLL
ncbi:MAG: PhzF family phenazine biosynthesis protein [Omnitrophica WOR_2 bacterium]